MSDDLRDLYQEVILEHSKRPRNFHPLEDGQKAEGFNPLCGDVCTVYVSLEGDVVQDVSFQGSGCAISTASASVMTETLKGKTRAEVEELFGDFHGLVTGTRSPRADRARQARRLLRRQRVPHPRQVRHPVLAHPARGPGRKRRAGVDGMKQCTFAQSTQPRRRVVGC